MNQPLWRAYVVELLGAFALVFFAAGVVCVDQMTAGGADPGQAPVQGHQPGLLGIALVHGLIFAVVLAVTGPVSGGMVNPAITVALGVFRRLPWPRVFWLIGAQMVGGVLAGFCLRFTFAEEILDKAHNGAPRINTLAYPGTITWNTLWSGVLVELVLSFIVVLAILGTLVNRAEREKKPDADDTDAAKPFSPAALQTAAILAGLALTACTLLGYSLTGAAVNPARWFGPALWDWASPGATDVHISFAAQLFVYGVGPLAGAVLAADVAFLLLLAPQRKTVARPKNETPEKGVTKTKK
jgi:glycerol uptake facilitator-like aquaporin